MKLVVQESMRLWEALLLMAPQTSKTEVRSWLKQGRVLVDGSIEQRADVTVQPNQTLSLSKRKKFAMEEVEILYEDRDFVVIDKPAGLLSVSSHFQKEQTAHAILKNYYQKPVEVVHRLDQDTSGVLLFARHEKARDAIKKLFEVHAIERFYAAIVEGRPVEGAGIWQSFLKEGTDYRVQEVSAEEGGNFAVTHYTWKASKGHFSWLELKLETGKKNQIRVHCQAAGLPIVGDRKYGATSNPLKRLGLHAHTLLFVHPFTHKTIKVTSPLPTEFSRLFQTL